MFDKLMRKLSTRSDTNKSSYLSPLPFVDEQFPHTFNSISVRIPNSTFRENHMQLIELHNFKNTTKAPQAISLSSNSNCMCRCYLDCNSSAVFKQQQQQQMHLIQQQQQTAINKAEPSKVFGEEHVYEEIEDEKYFQLQQQQHQQNIIPVYFSSCDKVEFINETHLNTLNNTLMDKTKRVRFQGSNDMNACTSCQNTFLLHSSNLVQNPNQIHFTNNSNSSYHHTNANNSNSILKKSLVNNLQNPIVVSNKQHLAKFSVRHSNGYNKENNSSSTSSSASSSSSFSTYTNNSSISSNFSLTSSNSYLFNQMVEDFLHAVQEKNTALSKTNSLKSASSSKSNDIVKKLNNSDLVINSSAQSLNEKTLSSMFQRNLQLSPSSNVSSDCSKSTTSSSNSSVNLLTSSPKTTATTTTSNMEDRLSFRVTNLTLDDLKRRQKEIYLTSTSVSSPLNQSVSSLSSSAPIQV